MDSRLQFPVQEREDTKHDLLTNSIELSLAEPWACKASWQEVVSNVFEVTTMMKKYSDHLEATNNNMKRIHESKNPARELSSNCNIRLISIHVGEIDERYSGLDSDLKNKELFDIQLSVPAGLYQHSHGKYLRTLNFIWRAPDTETDEEKCMLYRNLTGDASLANDQISKEMKERLRPMMSLGDPSIIIDLRTNNGFQGSKFDMFWNEFDGYFNEHNNTVINERRADTVVYILYVIYIRELRDRVIARLNMKYQGPPLPDDDVVPSEEWIRLNFALSNAYATKAMHYRMF
ncbi:hypothetical protein RirG_109860 [Rhizophagus irregularis DAOM 197198w]|uniref:Uncharacterized protein n=1 Tax=Rhizophagus irregularis (strain DAOM 197198w) TaxID=1432141 RepID=A0A015JL30_RHIIW|nr:hypothetical protein RirG_109860 [Rhizophagus irregularis DAOM 197198w]